ncbi:SCO family protein [Bdellovibrio bacteriovorus]|uniref:Thioredoxin domain-containing protein n=1 Tax=Bdellovibrio bacteriovorus TaxID=959 RepID=A0A1Z3N767_BDEBC|nr:SCO family protein [Bdellovibrio bacteriovorus]ASD63314.1 hypothetical protein B9G79_06875 [Bdellovibrio bacteriovorus]
MKKALLFAVALIPVALLALFLRPSGNMLKSPPMEFKIPAGGDFEIPSTAGLYKTSEKRGRVLFLFFGFAHCPHICPMTLANLSQMIQALPPEHQNKVEVLFVSIDPERDSLTTLAEHLKRFKAPMKAATDTHENLRKITSLFGARYSRIQTGSSFFVDHTSHVFVINSRGEWVETLDYKSPPSEYRQALETADDKRPFSERQIPLKDVTLLAENPDCDLATQAPCEIATSQGHFQVEMNPRPVREAQETSVKVRTLNTSWVPLLLDFEGVEQDMGFIRPLLSPSQDGASHEATYELPVCELSEMRWRVRLVLQKPTGEKAAVLFYMKTRRE